MDTQDLEIFHDVVALNGVVKAARRLGKSQSSVSETITSLEKQLGAKLFDRSTRPYEMTPAGRVVFEECREVLQSVQRLKDRLHRQVHKVVGQVRVGAIYSVGLLQMGHHRRMFESRYPDTALELQYLHPNVILEQVLSGQIDLGLISFAPKRSDLEIVPWQAQEMVLIVPPGHRFASRASIRPGELDGEPMVGYTEGLPIRDVLNRWLRLAKVTVEVTQTFDNIECIKRAVEIGVGVGIVPRTTIDRELELRSLMAVPFEDVDWTRPLGIIFRKGKPLSNAASRFLEMLVPSQPAAASFETTSAAKLAKPAPTPRPRSTVTLPEPS
jgi:DNA-binding transcriptional LysR family regulator